MVRITRRDFLKYCSVAAGALGLSASTLMKVENVLANSSAPTVVWIAGSACTGCTMSLLNSVFYTTVDDLLLNRINLAYLDTAMATAGAYINGVQYPGANALAGCTCCLQCTEAMSSLLKAQYRQVHLPEAQQEITAVSESCSRKLRGYQC